MRKNQLKVKVVLLGAAATGKTSIFQAWVTESRPQATSPTIGAAFHSQDVEIDGQEYSVSFWDTAGAERYKSMSPNYIKESSLALILYDTTNRDSFNQLQSYIDLVQEHSDAKIIIDGNKIDLVDNRSVRYDEAHTFASSRGFNYFETSATQRTNVDDLLNEVCVDAIQSAKELSLTEDGLEVSPTGKKQKGCCK